MNEINMDHNLESDRFKDLDANSLEEATLEPTSFIERTMDFQEAEQIESAFKTLMDSVMLDDSMGVTENIKKVPLPVDRALPSTRVAKVDSFTGKLGVAEDEVGQFRVPTKHPAEVKAPETHPVLDRQLEHIPKITKIEDDPLTHPGPFDAKNESVPDEPEDIQDMDIYEVAFLAMQSAQEDIEEDIAAISEEIEAMSEAKAKIRESLKRIKRESVSASFKEPEPVPSEAGEDSLLISDTVPGDHVEMRDGVEPTSSEGAGSSSGYEIKREASPAYTIDPESGVVHFGDGEVGKRPTTDVPITAHYGGSGDTGSQGRPDNGSEDDPSPKGEGKDPGEEDDPGDTPNGSATSGEREPPSDRSHR